MTGHSLKEDGRPAMMWFWDDWFSAPEVRICSLAARGLWIDMLGIMAKSEIWGTLLIAGKQIDSKTLAKICNTVEQEIKPLLSELKNNKVFSILEDGTIFCRRMLAESQVSQARSEAGKKGAEARWQTDGNLDGKPMANQEKNEMANGMANYGMEWNGIDIKKGGVGGLDAIFEKWWGRYPNKQDKGKAKEKWVHLVKVNKVDTQELEDALTGYLNCIKSKQTAPEYIKMAKTFLYPGKPDKGIPGTWEEFLPYLDKTSKPPVGQNVKLDSPKEEQFRKEFEAYSKDHSQEESAEWSQKWWEEH